MANAEPRLSHYSVNEASQVSEGKVSCNTVCWPGVTRHCYQHFTHISRLRNAGGTPIPMDCFHFFCSKWLNSNRFYSCRPRSIIQRNLWWRPKGAVTSLPFQGCIKWFQFRNILSWVIWCQVRSVNLACGTKIINIIYFHHQSSWWSSWRLMERTIPGIPEACHGAGDVTRLSVWPPRRLHCSPGMSPDFTQHTKHIIIICR